MRHIEVKDIAERAEVIGSPHDWVYDGETDNALLDHAQSLAREYNKLLRILQLLVVTEKVSEEELYDVIDATRELAQ